MTQNLNDVAAERAILSGLCQYGIDLLLDIEFIDTHHFNEPMNQMLFSCIRDCIREDISVELSAILSKANSLGFTDIINKDDEIAFIRSLFNFPVNKSNIIIYAAKIAKIGVIKNLKTTLKKCENKLETFDGNEELSDIISVIEAPLQQIISEVYNTSNVKPAKIGSDIDDYIQDLIDNPNSMCGVKTGFPAYDQAIGGGLRRKCVDVIGARTKVGKSLFADAVALHAAIKSGIPILMMDTEMDSDDHKGRILANLSSVPLDRIANGTFSEDEVQTQAIRKSASIIKDMPYHYINVSGQSFDYVLSLARQWIYQEVGVDETGRTNDCLIIYDYLKMMDAKDISESMKEYQILGFHMTKLHNFCVKYDVPCLTFIQLNRDGITKESTDAASGSDRIMWLCTSFSILKEKSPEEQADDRTYGVQIPFNRKLVPIISRHGGGLDTGDYINIKMEGQYTRLTQGPTRNQMVRNNGQEIETRSQSDISDMRTPAE